MALVHVHGPQCQRIDVVQSGKQAKGTQRSHGNHPACQRTIFLLQYHDTGRLPAGKQPIVAMTLTGRGVRDIVRGLGVSAATVSEVLKKKAPTLQQVNERLLKRLDPEQVEGIVHKVEEAEVDEMWSFVGSKSQQRWLWHAIAHDTGQVFASGCGTREDDGFIARKALREPFGLPRFYTDGWGAYRRHRVLGNTLLGNSPPRRSNANTPRCVPGSHAECGRPFVFRALF
jgi:insertion element IS1 protein InsB